MTPMTVSEVAAFLRRSVKSVKRLPIPFSRVGKSRIYDQLDVQTFLAETKECPSSSGPTRHTSILKSKSVDVGFAAALARAPIGQQKRSSAALGKNAKPKPTVSGNLEKYGKPRLLKSQMLYR